MRVGYQGIPGSNTELATVKMMDILKKEAELLPLVTPKAVVDALMADEIDFGVLAARNNTSGIVMECFQEVINKKVETIFAQVEPVHHCLFVKRPEISKEDINVIASHPQALSQCKHHIHEFYPNVEILGMEDTSIAANLLSIDHYPDNYAVLCTEQAGSKLGLHMLEKDFEDLKSNATEFRMFCKKIRMPNNPEENNLLGYWKYTTTEFEDEDINIQDIYGTPRIVRITQDSDGIAMEGWNLTKKPLEPIFFQVKKIDTEKSLRDTLIYEYRMKAEYPVAGLAELDFVKPTPYKGITDLSGSYRNYLNSKKGTIHFTRISKGDFLLLKNSQFLE